MPDDPATDRRQPGTFVADHALDPGVARHLRATTGCLQAVAVLFAAGVAVALALRALVLLALALPLAAAVVLALLQSCPPGKSGGAFWCLRAYRLRRLRVSLWTEGLIVHDGRHEASYFWGRVAFIRHDRFDEFPWVRHEGLLVEKARQLTVGFDDGRVLTLTDALARVEELVIRIQAEVYGRRLGAALEALEAGGAAAFGRLAVSRAGLEVDESLLPWEEVGTLALEGGRLVVRRKGRSLAPFFRARVRQIGDFPVLLALLEREQPDLARNLIAGLWIDAAAELWRRTTELRGQGIAVAPAAAVTDWPLAPAPPPPPPDHSGRPQPPDADFFAAAPPEIGPVVSAGTTLRVDDRPLRPLTRAAVVVAGALVGEAVGLAVVLGCRVRNGVWQAVWAGVPALALILLTWTASSFRATCTYVGTEGVARYRCRGRRGRVTTREVFLFRDARELRTSLTVHYDSNAYRHTSYEFVWTGPDGRRVYRVSGTHQSERGQPPPEDAYHFGEAAEVAWSVYLLDRAREELAGHGWVQFNLGQGECVRVGPGFLEFCLGGEVRRCPAGELDLAESPLVERVLCFRRRDARVGLFRTSGVYEIPYGRLANARLFLFLVGTLLLGGSAADADASRCRNFLDALEEASGTRWRGLEQDARAVHFIRESLGPEAGERLLTRLRAWQTPEGRGMRKEE